jgi:hypothetical protein
VDAEELFVHNCGKRKTAEGFHTSLVNLLGIFVLAFELESEVVGKMAAFMVTAQKPQGIWVPDLERPKVKHTLPGVNNA